MQDKIVVANWKMNFNVPESLAHFERVAAGMDSFDAVEVVVCPTFLALYPISQLAQDRIRLGAQNCNAKDSGALTGEVSAAMLEGIVDYVIVGHSERRQIFHESDNAINHKLIACLKHDLKPILCIGETLEQKQQALTDQVIRSQLDGALKDVQPDVVTNIIVAYEPVWAIGTVETPSGSDLSKVIEIIHSQFDFLYGGDFQPPILYGGSVDDYKAADFLAVDGVAGFLVGGASLNHKNFDTIISKAKESGE